MAAVWEYTHAGFSYQLPGRVMIVAKNEAIANEIAADPYLKERKAPSSAEQQLYLNEVSFACPLCGKILRHKNQKKANKLYEIAHIFQNDQIKSMASQFPQALPGHIRIQMAHAAGVDLNGGDADAL